MKTKKLVFNLLVATGLLVLVNACTNSPRQNQDQGSLSNEELTQTVVEHEVAPDKAICVLHPTDGNNVSGTVTFTREGENVKIVADIEGLTPGKHGFHIHEFGDCSASDGTSAGGHFNPDNTKHGAPDDEIRHVGDLGNVEAGEDGKAHLEITDAMVSMQGDHSIIGRAVVIHAGEDDFTSQPTGAAGSRLACGVIGIDE